MLSARVFAVRAAIPVADEAPGEAMVPGVRQLRLNDIWHQQAKKNMGKNCIVCESLKNKVVFQEFGIDIMRCTACGHVFSSYDANRDYDGYFGVERLNPQSHFWWNEAHKQMYEDFCHRFVTGKSGKLLDVGCGLGYFVMWVGEFSSWQVFGCEISRKAVDFAQTQLGLPNIFCGRVEDAKFPRNNFDIITLWDTIEHIPNPHQLLSHLSSLLNDNGMLFLHTPNVNVQLPKAKIKKHLMGMRASSHYLEAKDHINIYSAKTMKRILCQNGYNDVTFIHLKPIQSLAGSRNQFLSFLKNLWFYSSVALFYITLGRINLDSLSVLAKKRTSARS